MQARVAIIILNFNTFEDSCKCVESIYSNFKLDYCIYLVDNGSKNDCKEQLIKAFSKRDRLKLILLEENLGYSAGNNKGIQAAYDDGMDYFMIVNSDVIFNDDTASVLINEFEDKVAVIGPKVIKKDGSDGQQLMKTYSYVYALVDRMPFFWFSKKFGWFNSHIVPTQDNLVYEGMVSGCCFIVRKEILNSDHTLFDDNVFLYSEERILGIKIRELGYLVKYCPKTFIFHIEGNSTSKISSAFADYHRYISDYYTVVRYCTTNGFQRLLFKVLRLANFKGKVLKNSDYKERYRLLKRKMKEIDNHDYKIGY